jgi:protein phosphatase
MANKTLFREHAKSVDPRDRYGREYLRIIYGPEYIAADQLPGLRRRGLSGKRSLASRVRARPGSTSTLRSARAPAPGARVCLWRSGA